MNEITQILNKYGYKIQFESYHTQDIINQYKTKPEAVSDSKHFTIKDKEHHVIGRIYNIDKNNIDLNQTHIDEIIAFFKMFDISDNKNIINDITSYTDKINSNTTSSNNSAKTNSNTY